MSSDFIDSARQTGWAYAARQSARKDPEWLSYIADDCPWRVSHPVNEIEGRDAFVDRIWRPLCHSFPDIERRNDIFVAGAFADKTWVASTGYFIGTFAQDWLGIPANGHALFLRFAEIIEVFESKIVRGLLMFDIIDAARQAGIDLVPRGLGAEVLAPAPATQNGIKLDPANEIETSQTLSLLEAMIDGLMSYDQRSIASMRQEEFWSPDMLWYGPAGIGTAKGLGGFQRYHQIPFLSFVPDRVGGDHVARFADGAYAASGGWPSIRATTSGAPWISSELPAGVPVSMRVMDFWRRDGDRLKENWIFVDIPDVFRQCGIDVFEKLK
ncbi:MAG: ester cyclase [Pseudomonadota bacterium]